MNTIIVEETNFNYGFKAMTWTMTIAIVPVFPDEKPDINNKNNLDFHE